jgi:ATP-dependent Zn protease
MAKKSTESTAYREAAHVVAACLLKIEQQGVSIVPEGKPLGRAYEPLVDNKRYECGLKVKPTI